jgi:DNA repair exonuclease SbcCD nuclease subunit
LWSTQGERMKYIVMNDPHLDIKAPSSRRTDDYMETCFNKLYQVRDLCLEHGVDALCCTGDWFHRKNPQATPHRLTRALLDWSHTITDEDIPLLTILGNHDVQFNRTSHDAIARQPVSLLLANPRVVLLDELPIRINGVDFVGSSYRAAIDHEGTAVEDLEQFQIYCPLVTTVVQLTHASVVPHAVMWQPHTLLEDVARISSADICHTGHIHENLGIHKIDRSVDGDRPFYWTNTGSLTRGSLTEDTVSRKPNVLLVEVVPEGEPTFTVLELDHQPSEQIYDVAGYREGKVARKEFSEWTGQLQRELNATTEEKSLEALINESSLDNAGRDLARRLLNAAGA